MYKNPIDHLFMVKDFKKFSAKIDVKLNLPISPVLN